MVRYSYMKYVALLRGINVGGNNSVKMTELKKCFEELGHTNVVTYINSGNVIFDCEEKDQKVLIKKIEKGLVDTFDLPLKVVVVSHKQLKTVVEHAPNGFGAKPEKYRYDVIFLKPPLTAEEAKSKVFLKEGVDAVYAGSNVLYFSRLIAKVTQSKLNKIVGTPMYQYMTIRNWNTTTKLFKLMEG